MKLYRFHFDEYTGQHSNTEMKSMVIVCPNTEEDGVKIFEEVCKIYDIECKSIRKTEVYELEKIKSPIVIIEEYARILDYSKISKKYKKEKQATDRRIQESKSDEIPFPFWDDVDRVLRGKNKKDK